MEAVGGCKVVVLFAAFMLQFHFKMPRYSSLRPAKSGVPLGGIGAGKIEILPNGTLDLLTIQNNWSSPLTGVSPPDFPEGFLGFHFALVFGPGVQDTILLQTVSIRGYAAVRRIQYDGAYPRAELIYEDARLPIRVSQEAFSPLVLGDPDQSAWPTACFLFHLTNPHAKPIRVSLVAMARNIVGYDAIGRYNVVRQRKHVTSVCMRSHHQLPYDTKRGELVLSVHRRAQEVSYLGEWNLQTEDFRLDRSSLALDPLRYFREGAERLPNTNTREPIAGGGVELGGALAASVRIPGHAAATVPVSLTWHFPVHHVGHRYERRFRSAHQVTLAVHRAMPFLRRRTIHWQQLVRQMDVPPWLHDALINNLYPMTTSSMWSRDGLFALLESPRDCPLVGTLDVAFYGSIPVTLFFPSLDRVWLELFAAVQRSNGYIPHDFGRECFDAPSNGTTNFYWKDLAPKFALMVYRHYQWTGDARFLRRLFPAVIKAMDFCRSSDRDGDGLPENEGADQTFDMWRFRGVNVYTAGVVLAGLLAYRRMAALLGRRRDAEQIDQWFQRATSAFVGRLWNGRYFVACAGDQGQYDACMTAQLVGQWAAHLLHLGYIADSAKVRTAVRTILARNATASRFGAPNALLPNGRVDPSSRHAQTIWPGQCYALSALAIYEGFATEGLALARRTWDTFARYHRNPWNQPDVLFPDDGRYGFGDGYMRSMAIWSIPLALAVRRPQVASVLRRLCALARTSFEEKPR